MRDWIIHYVSNSNPCDVCGKDDTTVKNNNPFYYSLPGFANIHTHGLNKYNQKELCICIDIGGQNAARFLNAMGDRVANKETVFTEGLRTDILSSEMHVQFITFDNDPTLYMILPDSNGKLPMDKDCDMPFSMQKEYAEIISKNKCYV